MQNIYSEKKINEFAQSAMTRIQQEGLLMIPRNYELWFTYFAKSNPGVTRSIDVLEVDKIEITEEICQDIYDNFLAEESEAKQVHEAGDKIQETIKNVTGIVSNVKTATSKYSDDLDSVAKQLGKGKNQPELEFALKNIMNSTADMVSQNQMLEEQLSQSMQIMIEMKQDLDAVRKEAMTDALTNLANRKAFDEEIMARAIQVNDGEGAPFSLILMDIDHFKQFNDKFGHQLGDQVLRLVSRTLTDGVKGRDTAARYGGEEFGIILPETNLSGAMRVAENLRMAVSSKEITNRATGERIAKITLSGGVAEYKPGEPLESIIERSDHALYSAKRNGRNQIVAAADLEEKKKAK